MKIYKNNASVELSLEDFLELLEEDALEEIIEMVIDLDETGSIKGEYGDDIQFISVENIGDIKGLFDFIEDDISYYDTISEEDLAEIFGTGSTIGNMFDSDNNIKDNFVLSNEDLKAKRIVERFGHIDNASK